jgi:hypothetical protein
LKKFKRWSCRRGKESGEMRWQRAVNEQKNVYEISKELPVGIRQVLNMRRLVGVYDWVGLCLCVPVLRLRCCWLFNFV